jgi:V-type H+-transporting ATPase subunit a
LFTAATFPFLFGVMYGDIGHGGLLALAGLYLILTESRANSRDVGEMVRDIYSARYMLFMMGTMGVYAGLIYNDYFSLGLNLFGSNYQFLEEASGSKAVLLCAYGDPKCVYPFGADPVWKISANELLFFNSMKMKMSVILGITQMIFGVCLKGINALYFRSYLDFFCEFLPMIIFAVGFFGYMVILIFIKWSIDWDHRMALGSCNYDAAGIFGGCNLGSSKSCFTSVGDVCTSATTLVTMCPLQYGGTGQGCQPPNLITTLINIALKPGAVEEPMYEGQGGVQTFLLLVAFFCVPWLLLVKPLYLRHANSKKAVAHVHHSAGSNNPLLKDTEDHSHANPHESGPPDHSGAGEGGDHGHGGEFNFGEIFIHQAIETIEFVLGMVSNTASYLRLWALSLAHTELATVFWEKAMVSMIETNNPVLIFFGYAVFAAVTFGVLLCMDVLECFLHALRLHWVEFQNKFYKADGYRFQPFEFKAILSKAILE